MGRLFWKCFIFIWLGQMAAVVGTGALFWAERQQLAARLGGEGHLPPPELHRPGGHGGHPPDFARGLPPPRPPPPHGGLPVLPLIAGLVASLFCALALAWYFAKPIRRLRQAFDAAAEGDLTVRVGPGMNGRRDELADLGRDFDRMTAHLQAAMAAQKHLLHDVSHEMRSPLARLQAAIGLARQQPARMADSLQRIEREGERLNRLVGELLTLSRLESGVAAPLESVDMGELLADLIDDARFEGAARQVNIDYVAGEMASVRANPALLQRAIENVVRNALRFSPEGGRVRIEAGRAADGSWHLRVADQGPGVPVDQLEKIFKPFFRGDNQVASMGNGLGLAIAERVIVAVNGRIAAKNLASGGLLVELTLPACTAASPT